jgi:hypothetical protein
MIHHIIAETVLVLHFLFVLFVVFGLALIVAGGVLGWPWVRNRTFRLAHVLAIGLVVFQAWLGMICPLTHIENWARAAAGDVQYSGSFIAHWVERLLYYEAPGWVFVLGYTVFGMAVVAAWVMVPPRRRHSDS